MTAPVSAAPSEPVAWIHRHNRGYGVTYDVIVSAKERLVAYRDTLLEEIPLYTAASIESIQQDAERYRFLRNSENEYGVVIGKVDYWNEEYSGYAQLEFLTPEQYDAAIDAAILAARTALGRSE